MAGREAGYRHAEDTRKKIQASLIIGRLTDHCMGDAPIMDASQVNAAKALLNKVLPDLQAMQIEGEIKAKVAREPVDPDEWEKRHG